jgi:hypothetical protein
MIGDLLFPREILLLWKGFCDVQESGFVGDGNIIDYPCWLLQKKGGGDRTADAVSGQADDA